jgi:hypothetical protein
MPRKRKATQEDVPEDKWLFCCWIEILELKTGVKRELPLKGIRKIHIPRKKNDPQLPDEDVLQLEDGDTKFDAKDLEDLAAQLRARYPDEAYERRLFQVRDLDAEKRRDDALRSLAECTARAAVDNFLRDEAAKHPT